MLKNLFERIDSYKKKNWFQIRGNDVVLHQYYVHEFIDNAQFFNDLVTYMSSLPGSEIYSVLCIVYGDEYKRDLILANMTQANQIVGLAIGPLKRTEQILGKHAYNRRFASVVMVNHPIGEVKPYQEEQKIEETPNELKDEDGRAKTERSSRRTKAGKSGKDEGLSDSVV
jgi:hypothetical protein